MLSHRLRGGLIAAAAIVLSLPNLAPAGAAGGIGDGPEGGDVTALAIVGHEIFAGTGASFVIGSGGGVFRSSDQGEHWQLATGGLPNNSVSDLLSLDGVLYAGTDRGVFRSGDGGGSWIGPGQGMDAWANDLTAIGSDLYATTASDGIFKSTDGGKKWKAINKGITADRIWSIVAVGSDLYAGSDASGTPNELKIYKSTNGGTSWKEVFSGLPGKIVRVLLADGSDVFAGIHQGGILRSTDAGATWVPANGGLPTATETPYAMLSSGGDLYAGFSRLQIHTSSDQGDSWQRLGASEEAVQSLAGSGRLLYAGDTHGVTRSTDAGDSWQGLNTALVATNVLALHSSPSGLFAGTGYNGSFRSRDQGERWSGLEPRPLQVRAFTESTARLYEAAWARGVLESADGGDTWDWMNEGLTNAGVQALASVGGDVFLGTFRGLFRSRNGGDWTEITQGLPPNLNVVALMTLDSDIFALTTTGIFRSTDAGDSWAPANDGLKSLSMVAGIAFKGDLYVSTGSAGLHRSSDRGANWSEINIVRADSFATDGSHLFLADRSFVYRTSDGVTLEGIDVGTPLPPVFQALAVDDDALYVGTDSRGVLVAGKEPTGCVGYEMNHCVGDGRFEVRVTWRDFQGNAGLARAVPFRSDDSVLLYFFDAENWEMLVKVLRGCGFNNRYWVFAAATTNVEYRLNVKDTRTDVTRTYFNPLGTASPAITDTLAFEACSDSTTGSGRSLVRLDDLDSHPGIIVHETVGTMKGRPLVSSIDRALLAVDDTNVETATQTSCTPSLTQMCLSDDRFRVEVAWRDYAGSTGSAEVLPFGSNDSGVFYFFDEANWEMLVKVLDKCKSGHFWVFAAATTDVEYTLRVTDTVTDEVKEYFNPLGVAAPAITDIEAFATCP